MATQIGAMSAEEIIADAKRYTMFDWHIQTKANPLAIDRAEGVYMYGVDGRRWLDFSSQLMGVNIGHGDKRVTEAIARQAEKLPYLSPFHAFEGRAVLGKRLADLWPGDIEKTFFTLGGAEANENAVKMAKAFTGRQKVLARYRSYHGSTYATMALTGDPRRWPNENPPMPVPGCAGSMAALAPLRRASLGARRGLAANNAKRRISPCAARTRDCSRCRAGRWLTGLTVPSSGPRVRLPPGDAPADGPFEVIARPNATKPVANVSVKETDAAIEVDTGQFVCRIARQGSNIIDSISRGGREALRDGRLVLLRQDRAASADDAQVRQEKFEGLIAKVTVEQRGPVRAVVRLEGKHSNGSRAWLPFTLRFYFYAGSDALRVLHTIVFDGDESQDFIRGIGLRFLTPLTDALYDRHVRFVGERDGLFAEAVRTLTGLRRDPGKAARQAQIDGVAASAIAPVANNLLQYIPAFGDWTLLQPNANSFTIRKRTADGHAWLDAGFGRRASGLGYVGGPAGGVAFGIRNFWQSHPAQVDVKSRENGRPSRCGCGRRTRSPMDLRFYHDGSRRGHLPEQIDALEITYEDYEPGFDSPMGVARTSELYFWALERNARARPTGGTG